MTDSRLLIVYYTGDYREIYGNVRRNGTESYHGHRYSIDSMAALGTTVGEVGLLCCKTEGRYSEVLEPGLRAIGAGVDPHRDPQPVFEAVTAFDPTHMVVHLPMNALLAWSRRADLRTMAMLADYMPEVGVRTRYRNRRTVQLLQEDHIEIVGNHNTPASEWLAGRGVDPGKVIPWDWPHSRPTAAPKTAPRRSARPALVYVGLVIADKGVGDAIEAVAHLRRSGVESTLRIIGSGELEVMRRHAERLAVSDLVEVAGPLPHHEIVPAMAEADAVLVPSHHRYPEGFPLTVYEALASRTPIVASDHPMLVSRLADGRSAAVFPAGNPRAMAERVLRLLRTPEEYRRLSEAAEATWESLQVPTKWAELISRWFRDDPADREWIASRSVAAISQSTQVTR